MAPSSPAPASGTPAAAPLWRRLLGRWGQTSPAAAPAQTATGADTPAVSSDKKVKKGAGASLKRREPQPVGIPLGVARVPASEALPGRPAGPPQGTEPPLLTEALPTRQRSGQVIRPSPGRFVKGDEKLLSGLRSALVQEGAPQAVWVLYLLVIIVAATLAWAVYAKVDIITRAEGRIVPEAREQVIASLEAGILRALFVREGAVVQAGEELAQLDPTRVTAQQNEGLAKQTALRATAARLLAEVSGRPLSFPPEVRIHSAVVAAETEAYQARQQALQEAVDLTRRSIGLLDSELNTARNMAEQGLLSEVEVMRLRRQRNDLQMQMQERRNRFRQEASTELLRVRTELAQLGEQQVVREDALQRTVLKSPVRGIVKNIRVNTVGGVVNAGAPIMEIVPLTERVLVEARIKPADIGFVRVGLPAEIKLSAYDYFSYGGLKGTIEYISPDALGEEGRGSDGSHYRARIRTDDAGLQGKDGQPLQVLPGMTATVEIRTGDRTVMQFLLKPLFKGSEAMRER